MKKSLVLLSGGLDSTVNLLMAREQSEIGLVLTFDYGQKAVQKEKEAAARLCQYFKLPHRVLSLPFFSDLGKSSLIDPKVEVPTGSAVSIDDLQVSKETAKSVWVPNRNGIFLNIAAAFAEAAELDWIVPGFNREEATTFADNSEDFLNAATRSLWFSTANHVEVKCFTTDLTKNEIVALGLRLKIDFSWIWPCYFDGPRWCGQCESCQRAKRALGSQQVPLHPYFESSSVE